MFGNNRAPKDGGHSKNPFLRNIEKQTERGDYGDVIESGLDRSFVEPMSATGTVVKTGILTLLMLITAAISFVNPSQLYLWGGAIGGLVMVVIASMKPRQAIWAAPAYALLEGLFVGAVSSIYAYMMDGIIFQAVSLTVAVLLTMLLLYQTGAIKVTAKLRSGVMIATGAIFVVYLASIALSFFGITIPYLHQGGMIGIGISLLIIGVAAFNLLLDFDNIEQGVARGLPSRYEWVFSMGLLVTLVWLYVEILRLIAIMNRD